MTADTRRELVAGLTTFFTLAYIVVVNPSILSTAGTGMPFSGALTATVLLCFTMTLLMGLYARSCRSPSRARRALAEALARGRRNPHDGPVRLALHLRRRLASLRPLGLQRRAQEP